jgi:predicted glycoside hydrolase/deacetylase ChbG (UPF0249 family)
MNVVSPALMVLSMLLTIRAGAQTIPAKLIVRGDDMGSSHTANQAIIKAFKEGIVTSAEVMVNAPWFPEAVKLLKQKPGLDVGVHLTLTSEWENIKWRPLTPCRSLVDSNGYFFPMRSANENYPNQSLDEINWKLNDIENEFRAQIELAQRNIPQLSHVSAHMGCTELSEEVRNITKQLAKYYHIDIEPDEFQVISLGYGGPSNTFDEKKSGFIRMLETLESGKSYLFVDHPGFDNVELQAMFHIGYESVAFDRQGVTDVFTDKDVIKIIKESNIQLIGYNGLKSVGE